MSRVQIPLGPLVKTMDKVSKDDVIIFVSEFRSSAFVPEPSFFEQSEEEQEKILKEIAEKTELPLSLSDSVSVFKAQRLFWVADKKKALKKVKEIKLEAAKQKFEKEVERIETAFSK